MAITQQDRPQAASGDPVPVKDNTSYYLWLFLGVPGAFIGARKARRDGRIDVASKLVKIGVALLIGSLLFFGFIAYKISQNTIEAIEGLAQPVAVEEPSSYDGETPTEYDTRPCPLTQPPGLTETREIVGWLIQARAEGFNTGNLDCFQHVWEAGSSQPARDLAEAPYPTSSQVLLELDGDPLAYDGQVVRYTAESDGERYSMQAVLAWSDGEWRFRQLTSVS